MGKSSQVKRLTVPSQSNVDPKISDQPHSANFTVEKVIGINISPIKKLQQIKLDLCSTFLLERWSCLGNLFQNVGIFFMVFVEKLNGIRANIDDLIIIFAGMVGNF